MSTNFFVRRSIFKCDAALNPKIQATYRILGAPTHTAQGVHNTLIDRERSQTVGNDKIFTNFR